MSLWNISSQYCPGWLQWSNAYIYVVSVNSVTFSPGYVACSAPGHCLNQYEVLLSWKCIWKCRHQNNDQWSILLRWIIFNRSIKITYIIKCEMKLLISILNFSGCSVEDWEWISNFIAHFIKYLLTYPCRRQCVKANNYYHWLAKVWLFRANFVAASYTGCI